MEQINEFIGNNFLLFLAFAVILGLLVQNLWSGFTNKTSIDPGRVTELINREDALVVDVRPMADYDKGHIINAINIPSNGFKEQLHLLKNKEQPIIVVCSSGMTSGGICKLLHEDGFEKVYDLKGGMASWTGVNLPISRSKKESKKEGKKGKKSKEIEKV